LLYWLADEKLLVLQAVVRKPDPDPGRAKITHKNRKKFRNFIFCSAGCSLLRAESFSCSFDILYGDLGISKLHFSAVNFSQFLAIKTLDPDRY
jgi:hypothetical protein